MEIFFTDFFFSFFMQQTLMEKINKKIYKCHSFLKKYKRHSQSV